MKDVDDGVSAGAESILMDSGVFLSCFMPPAHQANTKYQSNEGKSAGLQRGRNCHNNNYSTTALQHYSSTEQSASLLTFCCLIVSPRTDTDGGRQACIASRQNKDFLKEYTPMVTAGKIFSSVFPKKNSDKSFKKSLSDYCLINFGKSQACKFLTRKHFASVTLNVVIWRYKQNRDILVYYNLVYLAWNKQIFC